ncbi:MAG: hypothetical protein ACXWZL_11835 [Mycobacterium sp.]
MPWILRERDPMTRELDADLRLLDQRRFAARRALLTFREKVQRLPISEVEIRPHPPPGVVSRHGCRVGHREAEQRADA